MTSGGQRRTLALALLVLMGCVPSDRAKPTVELPVTPSAPRFEAADPEPAQPDASPDSVDYNFLHPKKEPEIRVSPGEYRDLVLDSIAEEYGVSRAELDAFLA